MSTNHAGKLELISYHAGSLKGRGAERIREHLASCSQCREFIEGLERDKKAFLDRHPFESLPVSPATSQAGEGVVLKFRPKDPSPSDALSRPEGDRVVALGDFRRILAIAACLVIAVAGAYYYTKTIATASYRIKGGVDVNMFVKNAQGAAETRPDRICRPGEQVQFTYSCAGMNRLVLLSMDTAGSMTVYYPQSGDTSVLLQKGQGIPLPNSIVLDDYLGPELFCAVFSGRPLSVAWVCQRLAEAYRAKGSLDGLDVDFGSQSLARFILITKQGTAR